MLNIFGLVGHVEPSQLLTSAAATTVRKQSQTVQTEGVWLGSNKTVRTKWAASDSQLEN